MRGITMSIAGWLWADLLLGVFVLFAVANTGGPGAAVTHAAAGPTHRAAAPVTERSATPVPGLDPRPLELVVTVDGAALLGANAAAIAVEQQRIADEVGRAVGARRVAFVLAYGTHQELAAGDRLAALATARFDRGPFDGAAVKAFHNQVSGDRGSSVLLSIYFHQ